MTDNLPPLPHPVRHDFVGDDTEDLYTADQMSAYAAQTVAAERDCRTCRHFREAAECHSVLRCVAGSSYQRSGVVQLWEAAP